MTERRARHLQRDRLLRQPVADVTGAYVSIGGRRVLNFASTNYLALNRQPQLGATVAAVVARWGVSLSMPRLLADDPLSARLERMLAALVQREAALIFPSTTHIALDLLPQLAGRDGLLLVDRWAYPISIEGARLAQQRGARVKFFPHNDAAELEQLLGLARPGRSVIVCDGVYAADGTPAPLADFAALAARFGATIYVDDAHGLGVLGRHSHAGLPYGFGGGGTPLYSGASGASVIHVGSLAKAFGTPLAFVAGPVRLIDHLRTRAGTMMHSSPPALPVLAAALAMLRIHITEGEVARSRLVRNVVHLRRSLIAGAMPPAHSHLFPIQTLHFSREAQAVETARHLRSRGMWPVLQLAPQDNPHGAAVRFVVTAHHTLGQLARVGALLPAPAAPADSENGA